MGASAPTVPSMGSRNGRNTSECRRQLRPGSPMGLLTCSCRQRRWRGCSRAAAAPTSGAAASVQWRPGAPLVAPTPAPEEPYRKVAICSTEHGIVEVPQRQLGPQAHLRRFIPAPGEMSHDFQIRQHASCSPSLAKRTGRLIEHRMAAANQKCMFHRGRRCDEPAKKKSLQSSSTNP